MATPLRVDLVRALPQQDLERLFGASPHIHVAAGTYVASFEPATFDPVSRSYDPSKDKLPLLLNTPGLTLRGETVIGNGDSNARACRLRLSRRARSPLGERAARSPSGSKCDAHHWPWTSQTLDWSRGARRDTTK
jgi:hypothetical protein